jgi:hypothetical protein
MVDDRSPGAEQIDGMAEKTIRGHALPCRVGGREMLANVAETACTQ